MTPGGRGDGSRQRILDAAAKVVAERGYEGTTISRVTTEAGLSASSVYWFFADKDELMSQVVEHSFRHWLQERGWWDPPPPRLGFGEEFYAVLRGHLESLRDPPAFVRIGQMLLLDTRADESLARRRLRALRAEAFEAVLSWFVAALTAQGVPAPDARAAELAHLTVVFFDGCFLAHQVEGAVDVDTYVEVLGSVIRSALDGRG